jgi:phytoene dehydrogenase-like protein
MADGRLWSDLDEPTCRERRRDLEACLVDRLGEAIPDARERIEVCETGTPHTMSRYSINPLRSIYGYAFTPSSHSIHRPQPPRQQDLRESSELGFEPFSMVRLAIRLAKRI